MMENKNDIASATEDFVYQILFLDEIDDVVIMTSLSKVKIDDFIQSVRDHDHAFVAGSKHDLDGSYDAAHPLARWREDMIGGGKFSDSLEHGGQDFWAETLKQVKYLLE